ncbi:MAG: LolA family protein [Planctomycetota bacterium]
MPRGRCRALFLILCGLISLGAQESAPAPAEVALQRIVAQQQQHSTAVGRLQRTVSQAAFPNDPPARWDVRLWLRAPDHYRIRLSQEDDGSYEGFLSDGVTRWRVEKLFPEDPPEISAQPVDRDGSVWRTLGALLPLDQSALQEDFRFQPELVDDGLRLRLVPVDAGIAEHLQFLDLHFTADDRLAGFEFLDQDGNREVWTVHELSYPEILPDAVFTPEWQPES